MKRENRRPGIHFQFIQDLQKFGFALHQFPFQLVSKTAFEHQVAQFAALGPDFYIQTAQIRQEFKCSHRSFLNGIAETMGGSVKMAEVITLLQQSEPQRRSKEIPMRCLEQPIELWQ